MLGIWQRIGSDLRASVLNLEMNTTLNLSLNLMTAVDQI